MCVPEFVVGPRWWCFLRKCWGDASALGAEVAYGSCGCFGELFWEKGSGCTERGLQGHLSEIYLIPNNRRSQDQNGWSHKRECIYFIIVVIRKATYNL